MPKRHGIDLGTTKSVIAILENGLRALRNKEGEVLTPSVVAFYLDRWQVGQAAKDNAMYNPENTVYSVKRFIGRNFKDPNVQKAMRDVGYKIKPATASGEGILIEVGGRDYEPQDISAMVLKKMKDDVEYLNPTMHVDEVVITTPAYFNESQRAATREAGKKAGLTVLSILPEPTAAAYAYGIDPEKHDGRTILVYDMGGGTFDVSIIMISEGDFLNLGLDGDMWLGGDDMDKAIIDMIVNYIQEKYKKNARQNKAAMVEIKVMAEKAKKNLSTKEDTETEINEILRTMDNIRVEMTITKRQYEAAIAPLVDRSMELVDRAIGKSGVPEEQIQEVLMVGGATRTPLVRETVIARFGEDKVKFTVDPVECVGIGAAIYAARFPTDAIKCPRCGYVNNKTGLVKCQNLKMKCDYQFTEEDKTQWFECTSCHKLNKEGTKQCSCGVFFGDLPSGITAQPYGVGLDNGSYSIVLKAGTSYPVKEAIKRIYYTVSNNQKTVNVPVYCGDYQGEASQNDYMGNVMVALHSPVAKGTPVEIGFRLDRNLILEASVEVKDDAKSHATAIMERGAVTEESNKALDEIKKLRKEAGARLTEQQNAELDTAESRIASIRNDPTLDSKAKQEQIRKVSDNVKRIAEELGLNKKIPAWLTGAKGYLNAIHFAHEKIGRLVDPAVAIQMPKLASNLEKAIELEDEKYCKKYENEFDEILKNLEKDAAKVWQAYLKAYKIKTPASQEAFIHEIDQLVPKLEKGDYAAEKELDAVSSRIDKELARQQNTEGPEKEDRDGVNDKNNPFSS